MQFDQPLTTALLLAAGLAWPSLAAAQPGWYYHQDFSYADIEDADVGFRTASGTAIDGEYEIEETGGARIGVGYRWTPRLRGELTLDLLQSTTAAGPGAVAPPDPDPAPDPAPAELFYTTSLQVQTLLINGYFDWLPNAGHVRPYVGAGIGAARLELGDTTVTGDGFTADIRGDSTSEFAWRVEIGAAMPLTWSLLLTLAYAYLDAGEARSGTRDDSGGRLLDEPSRFDVEINQVLLGLIARFEG